MNTPIRYFGGKGTMFNSILEHFPENGSYDHYIEPFGGSYSIGLKLEDIPPVEIYNDMEQNDYSLYKVLADKELFNEFKYKCDLAIYSEDLRAEFKEKLKEELSLVDRAFYYYYVNRTSFNGNGGFTINTSIRRGMAKSISDFLSSVDRLPELHERLSRVAILNQDGIKLIEKYNKNNMFLYCDPPYEQSTRTSVRYPVDMHRDKQFEFIESVIKSNAKILISGYDCDVYSKLTENGFSKIMFDVNTVTNKGNAKTKVETLWKNY